MAFHWFSRRQTRNVTQIQQAQKPFRKPHLGVERLEDRCVPSVFTALELDGGLLFSDTVFGADTYTAAPGPHNSNGGNRALMQGPAGNSTGPVVGSSSDSPTSTPPNAGSSATAQMAANIANQMPAGNPVDFATQQTAGGRPLGASPVAGPQLLTNFNGISFANGGGGQSFGGQPPYTNMGVGPNQIVEVAGQSINWYNKATTALITHESLAQFFAPAGAVATNMIFQAQAAFDEQTNVTGGIAINVQRFVVIANEVDAAGKQSFLDFAVSKGSDLSAGWQTYRFVTTETVVDFKNNVHILFSDYTQLGWDQEAWVITMNMWNYPDAVWTGENFLWPQVISISKSDVLTGAGSVNPNFQNIVVGGGSGTGLFHSGPFTFTPVRYHFPVPGSTMFYATEDQSNPAPPIADFTIWAQAANNVLQPGGAIINGFTFNLPPNAQYFPAMPQRQPGGSFGTTIAGETDTSEVLSFTMRGNLFAFTNQVDHLRDQLNPNDPINGSLAAWYEGTITNVLDSNNPGVNYMQSGQLNFGYWIDSYSPSIDIAFNSALGMTFDTSNSDPQFQEFPTAWITGHNPNDPVGTMETPVQLATGLAFFSTNAAPGPNSAMGVGEGLWGPGTAGVAIDPISGLFWAASQFADLDPIANWGTRIATFALAPTNVDQGTFFTDGINQLWLYDSTSHTFTNTGGFAKAFSAGLDLTGRPEVWFTDGNNQLWKWDAGTFTNTGSFASNFSAGFGMVFFTDGSNQLWTYRDYIGFHNTGAFATVFSGGYNSAGQNELSFLDGVNQLWIYDVSAGTMISTGGFASAVRQAQDINGQNETYFLDGINRLYRYDGFASTIFTFTGGFAQPANYFGSQGMCYFLDGNNQLWFYTDATKKFTNTGAYGLSISSSPGTSACFFRDGSNAIWMLQNGTFTSIGSFGVKLSAF
jgi:hypothetical protein